jgi:hypothetical protein
LTGQSSPAAVVITTLMTAARFNTLRQSVQSIIDRQFFRQKYNTDRALAQFALAARGSADLDYLTAMLVDITQETLQPTRVNLQIVRKK